MYNKVNKIISFSQMLKRALVAVAVAVAFIALPWAATAVNPKVVAAVANSLALKNDGTVWAWGNNDFGQLGDGTTTSRSTPVQVAGLSGVIDIAMGMYHSLALKNDGTVWAWGHNRSGQLGDGTTIDRRSPVQVSGLSGVLDIAGGGYHSIALKGDGTVWAWGDNDYKQLGDGTISSRSTPILVSRLSSVIGIAVGHYHSLALKSDGAVWAWGFNTSGQLGDGTISSRNTPVHVSDLSGVIDIATGGYYSLALKNDGTVWVWGHNSWGQLGDGTTTDRRYPVQISRLTGVINIAGGLYHSLALKSDGTVSTWGRNSDGQLGDGTTTDCSSPVQVTGLNLLTTTYTLTVNSGIGSGNYAANATVNITANEPPSEKEFDRWTSSNGGIFANVNSAITTFTMPANATTVTATYKDITYTLTVNNGNGSGNYAANATVNISANAPPSGKVFDKWTSSNGGSFENANSTNTTFTMPANATTLTAIYKDAPATIYPLTVNNGTGSGNYASGTLVTIIANAPPSGQVFDCWTTSNGGTFTSATDVITIFAMPNSAVTVTATYKVAPVTTYALTVNNGTGSGSYATGMPVTIIANAPPAGQVFDSWTTSGSGTFANANYAATTFTMPASAVTVTATYKPAPMFALTVVNGAGSGNYAAGAMVTITANTPPSGQVFDMWMSSNGGTFANTNGISTTFTMPANATTVTATFRDVSVPTYALTVYNGSGSGNYPAGTAVTITANAPPPGQVFDFWITNDGGAFARANDATTTFTMPNSAVSVTAMFASATSIVDTENNPSLQAWTQNSALHIDGITEGRTLSVYNLVGIVVYKSIATGDKIEIPLPARGIYIITDGNNVIKVVN